MISTQDFWIVTLGLGIGTFLIRFSFLGFMGGRQLPAWMMLHLKYVGAAVFPALIMPGLIWPSATGGQTDPIRLVAALAALAAGMRFSVVWAIIAGMGTLYALQALARLI